MKGFKSFILIVILLLTSCRVTKEYYNVETEVILVDGVRKIPATHLHEDNGIHNYCFYIEEYIYRYTDTIHIECFELGRKRTFK